MAGPMILPSSRHSMSAVGLPGPIGDQYLGSIAGLTKLQRTDKVSAAGEGS